jgi:hypothetical protein
MAAVFAGNLGMFFLITLYLQLVEHYSAVGTGLAFLPFPVILGVVAAQMRRLIGRHGYRRYLILGPALVATGMAWVCFLPVHGNYFLHLLPGFLVMPVGFGMSFPSAYAAATSRVPARQAGLASGLITTAQQLGGAVGLTVISAVAASYTASLTRDSGPQALTSGYDLAMAVAAGPARSGLDHRVQGGKVVRGRQVGQQPAIPGDRLHGRGARGTEGRVDIGHQGRLTAHEPADEGWRTASPARSGRSRPAPPGRIPARRSGCEWPAAQRDQRPRPTSGPASLPAGAHGKDLAAGSGRPVATRV